MSLNLVQIGQKCHQGTQTSHKWIPSVLKELKPRPNGPELGFIGRMEAKIRKNTSLKLNLVHSSRPFLIL